MKRGKRCYIVFTEDTVSKLKWSPLEIATQKAWERFGFKVVDSAPGIIGYVGKLHNPLSAVTGKGYRRGRLRKDSPEAKAYMARLRAMRRRRYYFYFKWGIITSLHPTEAGGLAKHRSGALRCFGSLAGGTLNGGFTSIPAVTPSHNTSNPEEVVKKLK